ncbi:eCIS core domain-containing protein [Kitasatospora purpeofusca]|uniref:eCIS core domain-containing protein n=1 Tax=Kitasatospora purpeofusca TaxID=67352 RepID=UPI003F5DAD66
MSGPVAEVMSPEQARALQRSIGNAVVARMARGGREEQGSEPVQRSGVHEVLRGAGRPLQGAVRAEMEGRLGADFSDVRLHTGAAAQRSAAEIGARAYTSGRDVVIGHGGGDKHTLAHELTHVIQQRKGAVAGTDRGDGLRVSHPGDSFEREAEANARRVMARPAGRPEAAQRAEPGHASEAVQRAEAGHAAGAAEPAVQRKLGFETEIDMPVENARGEKYEGDTDLAQSTAGDFKLVSDSRSLNNRAPYSNLEFVTGAVAVVGTAGESGPETLEQMVDEIRAVREAFYEKTGKTPLAGMGLQLEILPAGQDARIAPDLDFPNYAGAPGMGDGLFVHYSVGVPLAGMPMFFDHLREAAPQAPGAPLPRARFRLSQSRTFAEQVVARYVQGQESARKRKRLETDALDGYSQLFFMQVAAMADYLAQDQDQGQIKNLTVVLSRSQLTDVRALLDPGFQEFLSANSEVIVDLLAHFQEDPGDGSANLEFRDEATREIDGLPVSLLSFAESTLKGVPQIPQQSVFGGMNQIAPHEEEGAMMVPFEIRTMGSLMKTWDELKAELRDLAAWAEEAYRHDRSLAGDSARTRTGS